MRRNEVAEHPVGLRLTRMGAEKVIRSCHQDYRRHGATARVPLWRWPRASTPRGARWPCRMQTTPTIGRYRDPGHPPTQDPDLLPCTGHEQCPWGRRSCTVYQGGAKGTRIPGLHLLRARQFRD